MILFKQSWMVLWNQVPKLIWGFFVVGVMLLGGIGAGGCSSPPSKEKPLLAKGQWACPQCGKVYNWAE